MKEHPDFTYEGYRELLALLRNEGYAFASYHDWAQQDRPVILRHDIDYDVTAALKFAQVEADFGAKSTYFALLRNGLYNCLSPENIALLKNIASLGHDIGLHFDEKAYPAGSDMMAAIQWEARVLSDMLELPITSVSMHRPSEACLKGNWEIPGMVNSYDRTYFNQPFKYVSDSRRRWREPVYSVIRSGDHSRLHVLTHAFWYHDTASTLKGTIQAFVDTAPNNRKALLAQNFTDLDDVLAEGE